jgi:hypothetical protein
MENAVLRVKIDDSVAPLTIEEDLSNMTDAQLISKGLDREYVEKEVVEPALELTLSVKQLREQTAARMARLNLEEDMEALRARRHRQAMTAVIRELNK